jgi:phosphate transport system substrate-binding protein
VHAAVASTPNSIGYLGFAFLDGRVRPVSVDGAKPTIEDVQDGTYPVARPFNMLTKGAPGELAQAFLDFVMGPEGQAIIAEDYVPVGPIKVH